MSRSKRREKRLEAQNKAERVEKHFGIVDLWGFEVVNAQAQIWALTRLRDMAHGFPGDLLPDPIDHTKEDTEAGFAEWIRILNVMIDGWQSVLDVHELIIKPYDETKSFMENVNTPATDEELAAYRAARDECDRRFRAGMALYVEYYHALWD